METNQEKCLELARRIYELDSDVYQLSGSLLGRTFNGDKERNISTLAALIYTHPQGHVLRSEIALIGNMARTISSKADRSRMMRRYNDILQEIEHLPSAFGSVDIVDDQLAALNISNPNRPKTENDHLIICIGRTHGSAGTDIGFALADALKINYYDMEIFNMVLDRLDAEKDSFNDRENFSTNLEHAIPSAPPKSHPSDFSRYHGLPKKDAIFFNQSDLILDMAKKEDFIVMGRCADVILANNRIPHISIFITAPFQQRVHRMMEVNHLEYKETCRLLKQLDRKHERYYRFYTGRKWGDAVNYDFCINSACYGIKESVELIQRMIDKYPAMR